MGEMRKFMLSCPAREDATERVPPKGEKKYILQIDRYSNSRVGFCCIILIFGRKWVNIYKIK